MNEIATDLDQATLDWLRRTGSASIPEFVDHTGVTATAVRQRLNRLMAAGLVERSTMRGSRGRPGHRYSLTEKGIRAAGTNYADLAVALWDEVRSIADPEVRRGLLQRLVNRLGDHYKKSVRGDTIEERLRSLAGLLGDRNVP